MMPGHARHYPSFLSYPCRVPFEVTLSAWFSAAHQLRLEDGALEPLHGHNWRVRLVVAREDGGLDAIGTVHDFHDLQRRLDAVLKGFHNTHLNELPAFGGGKLNPTTENVAFHIATSLRLPAGLEVTTVEVWETPDCSATWRK